MTEEDLKQYMKNSQDWWLGVVWTAKHLRNQYKEHFDLYNDIDPNELKGSIDTLVEFATGMLQESEQ